MYKRIYDSDEIVVDYHNDGKPMIRVSVFDEDGHWTGEHFLEAEPVVHAHWERVIPTKSAAKWSTKVSCSNCHREGYTRYPRCPNCGAYMSEK